MPEEAFSSSPVQLTEESALQPDLILLPPRPKQINLFTGEDEIPRVEISRLPRSTAEIHLDEGITVVQSPDGFSVNVSGWGVHVGKKSERLQLKKKDGKAIWHFPLSRLSELHLTGSGVAVTTDLLSELAQRGIRVTILAMNGKPLAQISSPMLTASVATRKAQLEATANEKGLMLAVCFASGKLLNQARLLKYFGKNLHSQNPGKFSQIQERIRAILALRKRILSGSWFELAKSRPDILGFEGAGAREYWSGVRCLIEKHVDFQGRVHRGAQDFVNSLLNYGYGILYAQVWGAVMNAGLEPFTGFLHTDRPGKPSMVLDLTEEFRAPVVDRMVISSINLGQLKPPEKLGSLNTETRNTLVEKILARLDNRERFQGGDYRVRSIIQIQARKVVSFLLGREKTYQAFRFKW